MILIIKCEVASHLSSGIYLAIESTVAIDNTFFGIRDHSLDKEMLILLGFKVNYLQGCS